MSAVGSSSRSFGLRPTEATTATTTTNGFLAPIAHPAATDAFEVASSIGDAERDLHSEFGDEQDTNWDDWEDEEGGEECRCLVCELVLGSVGEALSHAKEQHGFDLGALRRDLGLDFYGSIRLINYIRTCTKEKKAVSAEKILKEGKDAAWATDDTYLRPVLDDDPLLYAFEDEDDEEEENVVVEPIPNGKDAAPTSVEDELRAKLALAEQRASLAERRLDELTRAFGQYKDMVREAFLDEPKATNVHADSDTDDDETADPDVDPTWEMDYYFGSYAESEIHESMLKDRTRTEAYRDFIYHNKDYFKDKIVLDVGCGTGILSMFAAKAGAKKVFAVDNSTIINKAKRIVKDNGLDQIITFVQGKVEEISLPVEHVDIIISEWMGYFLLYEGMLDSVLHARDRWLRPNTGLMAPSRTDILLTAIQDEEWINDKYHFWNEVYGFNMAVMKRGFLNDGCVDHYDPDMIVADVQTVKRIDIGSTTVADLDFTSPITLTATKDARVNGLLGWFDTFFTARDEAGNATSSPEQIEDVTFSTGPYTTPTHWKQTAFPFEHALEVRKGETISGTFECRKHSDNHRELTVIVDVCVRDAEGSVRDGSAVRKEYIVR